MDKLLLALSTLCFLGGFLNAVVVLRSGKHSPTRANLIVIGFGFLLQCGVLYIRGQLHGRCPVTSGAEILVFLSWATVLLYFLLGRTFRLSLLGVFTSPMVFVFQSIALLLLRPVFPVPGPRPPVDPMNEFHITMSLLAYGAFALAGIAGIMYFVQDRQLKKHQLGTLFQNLPPIRYLVDALKRLLGFGLLLLTAGIVTAFLISEKTDPLHALAPVILWIVYAGLLGLHLCKWIGPRKFAGGAIIAAILSLLTLVA